MDTVFQISVLGSFLIHFSFFFLWSMSLSFILVITFELAFLSIILLFELSETFCVILALFCPIR